MTDGSNPDAYKLCGFAAGERYCTRKANEIWLWREKYAKAQVHLAQVQEMLQQANEQIRRKDEEIEALRKIKALAATVCQEFRIGRFEAEHGDACVAIQNLDRAIREARRGE